MWNSSVHIVLCLCVSGSLSLYTTCKDGWLPFRGSCYLFQMATMPFTTAEQFCRQHDNSHLVHVNDAMENGFLKDRLRMFKDSVCWIGLTDENIEGVWKWFDTDDLATFTDFKLGDGGSHNTKDCVGFIAGYDKLLADISCSLSVSVLCENSGHGETEVVG